MFEDNNLEQDYTLEATIQENSPSDQKVVSITEAARINNVTRQAIYVAIKQKKLKAKKDSTRWTIDLDDLEEYRKNKYSRTKSMFDGELLFDNNKGYYSVNQVAKMLNVPAQKIYYATRVGHLKASRKGAAWVMSTEDINEYKEKYLSKTSVSA
ncbi:MAG: DNA-binding protein [Chlamydiae bacterium CG10_big_fil_rev_8_21_14_0_10_35_9]|nr:MAG: DNA-binding protein [Chlamydiae bacterium CG10_big_fil_rev_8_21_14_0_10_35_9]